VLLEMLGSDYAIQAAPDLLFDAGHSRHPTEVADLCGCRLAVCSELGSERKLNGVLVKQLTGGDRIRARRMHENYWEFEPTHHLWIGANHFPAIPTGDDPALLRRLMIIPFGVTIPSAQRDPGLLARLRLELEGILAWAVEGCREWREVGLSPPTSIDGGCDESRFEMDRIEEFLETRCSGIRGTLVRATELFHAYAAWCADVGAPVPKQKAFGQRLTLKGLERKKVHGIEHYCDLSLRPITNV